MKKVQLLAAAAALLFASSARADFDAGPFPLGRGNQWTYARDGGGEVAVTIDLERTTSGTKYSTASSSSASRTRRTWR